MSSRCGASPSEYTNRRSKRSMPLGVRSCSGDSCTGVNSAPSDRVVSATARSRSGTTRPVTKMSPNIAPPLTASYSLLQRLVQREQSDRAPDHLRPELLAQVAEEL